MTSIPNTVELKLISIIQKYLRSEYAIFRMTQTMINKATVDASSQIRNILIENEIFDYSLSIDGKKNYLDVDIFTEKGIVTKKSSFYRPRAKPSRAGDPRFWPSTLHKFASEGTLIYLTSFEGKLLLIPLTENNVTPQLCAMNFKREGSNEILDELLYKIIQITDTPIKSCSPKKLNNKDVGDTLEKALGLEINNSKLADFKEEIEIKGKSGKATKDTLFCKVQDPKISNLTTVAEVIDLYGYESKKDSLKGYKSLFVTVSTKPNPQGLYLEIDTESEQLIQRFKGEGEIKEVCRWSFKTLKQSLFTKHPQTVWVKAKREKVKGDYHFIYQEIEVTKKPLFSQFLTMLEQGKIVFEWRGANSIDGKSKKIDYGHAFRLNKPSERYLLFGDHEVINIQEKRKELEELAP